MQYLSVAEVAKKWNVSERSVKLLRAGTCTGSLFERENMVYSGKRRKARAFQ